MMFILAQVEAPQPVIHEWAYVLGLALPALIAALAVVWQGRKTRRRGTEEHVLGRELMIQHGVALNRIEGKVDTLDGRVVRLERDAKTGRDDADTGLVDAAVERAEILDRVVDHVDVPGRH